MVHYNWLVLIFRYTNVPFRQDRKKIGWSEDLPHRLQVDAVFLNRAEVVHAVVFDVEIGWARYYQLDRASLHFSHVPAVADHNKVFHG